MEQQVFNENVDSWIKQFGKRLTDLEDMGVNVDENTNNIQENYEMLIEMEERTRMLKEDLTMVKASLIFLFDFLKLKDELDKIRKDIKLLEKEREKNAGANRDKSPSM